MLKRTRSIPGRSRRTAVAMPRRHLLWAGAMLAVSPWAHGKDKAPAPKLEPWDNSRFDAQSTVIDNPWLPMKPGTRFVYEGTTVEDDGKVVPHRIEINITDLSKLIDGVRVLVSYDLDISDGGLAEAELALFAQDRDGNVWHLGQYPEEYEDGKLTKAPAWIHGIEGARAGIMMKAKPRPDTPSYSQGWGPAVKWTDRGQTYQTGQTVTVPAGTYKEVLVIKETAASEVGAYQLKYYARGVGNVKVGWLGADKTKESLALVRVEQLGASAMDDVRAQALKLEQSAYANSKNVYGKTSPAERLK